MTLLNLEINEQINLYLQFEERLNQLFTKINFCIPNCVSKPGSLYSIAIQGEVDGNLGCCIKQAHDYGARTIPTEIFAEFIFQRIKKYGPPKKSIGVCGYHTDTGCKLKTHKPPVCVAYTCPSLHFELEDKFGIHMRWDFVAQELEAIIAGQIELKELKQFDKQLDEWIKIVKTFNVG